MIAFIEGKKVDQSPAHVVIENGGVGYHIQISLHTYSEIQHKDQLRLFTHHYISQEQHPVLYGFSAPLEKKLFLQLISVSKVGPNTARMILSSYSPREIIQAIIESNLNLMKSIKGIGPKSAQRIILELKDKLGKDYAESDELSPGHNTAASEALSALLMLGFSKPQAQKAIKSIATPDEHKSVEEIVKQALKIL